MDTGTCATIHLDNLADNYRAIRDRVAPAAVIPVVKADAYGHGAVAVARRLAESGAALFAVAQFKEAMVLRDSGISQPILIFGRLFPDDIPAAVKAGFRLTLFGTEDIRWIEKAGLPEPARVHVNLDTGMGRMGVLLSREPGFFDTLTRSRHCAWEGLYSHFSTSDEADKAYAAHQLRIFRDTLADLDSKGQRPPMVHMANSGGILDIAEARFDAVRPGILLYGHYPSRETSESVPIRQVMTLKTTVAHLRKMPANHPISYGRLWQTPAPTTIAVLPIGYADGLRRDLTGRGEVLIREKRYPIVGRVTMDHVMVDAGNDPIRIGDQAIVWGDAPGGGIQVLDVAESIGTIPYELTCGVSRRVPRVVV